MLVSEYLLSDRQWPRHLRLSHAKMQLGKANTIVDREFWLAIVSANTVKAETGN